MYCDYYLTYIIPLGRHRLASHLLPTYGENPARIRLPRGSDPNHGWICKPVRPKSTRKPSQDHVRDAVRPESWLGYHFGESCPHWAEVARLGTLFVGHSGSYRFSVES